MPVSSSEKKKIKYNRMVAYFTEATIEIINEEGLDGLTIRKIADKAGYNSATLYHYFPNLKHLTLFASMHYLKDYALDLSRELPKTTSPMEAYLKVWECFCRRSYQQPDIYKMIFFTSYKDLDLNLIIKTYYEVFADEITGDILEYSSMMTESNIFKRESISLNKVLRSIHCPLSEDTVKKICEMNILIYRGMLSLVEQDGPLHLNVEDAVSRTVEYMHHSLLSYGVPENLLVT